MTTTVPSNVLATIQPVVADTERFALTRYRSLTREACALDLRQFTNWCRIRSLALFADRRAYSASFACELETAGRARAPVTRRLSTIAGFYKSPSERNSWNAHPPPMSAGHESITSRMP